MSKTSTKLEDLIEIKPITKNQVKAFDSWNEGCLLYTSPSPRD